MGAIPETMMSNSGTTPWHGIGTVIDRFCTGREALHLGGIAWGVHKSSLYLGGSYTPLETHVALKTTDGAVLDVVSPKYEILQNTELADIADELDLSVQTCGQMWGGKFVWMLVDLGESPRFDGTDEAIHRWLLISTWHGSGSFRIEGVNMRVVCENTLKIAVSGGELFHSIQHRSSAQERLAEAKAALVETYTAFDEFDAWAAGLMDKAYSRVTFGEELLPALFPKPADDATDRVKANWMERRADMRRIFDGPTIGGEQTAWHFLQTVNEYELHVQGNDKGRQARIAGNWAKDNFPLTNKAARILVRA